MSADNYFVLRKHPTGGFALVMGFASVEKTPEVKETEESFPTLEDALKAFCYGQQWENDDELYPRYYCEYGLQIHPDCFETAPQQKEEPKSNLVQTRSEQNGLGYWTDLDAAKAAANEDESIWKISYTDVDGNRVRLIRQENDSWKEEPLMV